MEARFTKEDIQITTKTLKDAYLSLLLPGILYSVGNVFPFLLCLLLLISAVCKVSSENHVSFLHFVFFGMVLVTAFCIVLWTSVHSSSDTLSTTSNPLNLFHHLHCIILREWI